MTQRLLLLLQLSWQICFGLVGRLPSNRVVIGSGQYRSVPSSFLLASLALEPEPGGGWEVNPRQSMPGCRVKQMEDIPQKKSTGEGAYKFWLTGKVDGKLIQEIRTQILKDAAKKANFPGFRKGQVPPYAQPQITNFAVQEGIIKTVEAIVEAYGLKTLPGSDGELKVHEDVALISQQYKTGDSVSFTANLNAAYDPDKRVAPSSNVGIVEAEIPVGNPEISQ